MGLSAKHSERLLVKLSLQSDTCTLFTVKVSSCSHLAPAVALQPTRLPSSFPPCVFVCVVFSFPKSFPGSFSSFRSQFFKIFSVSQISQWYISFPQDAFSGHPIYAASRPHYSPLPNDFTFFTSLAPNNYACVCLLFIVYSLNYKFQDARCWAHSIHNCIPSAQHSGGSNRHSSANRRHSIPVFTHPDWKR